MSERFLLLPDLTIQSAPIFQPDIISGALMPTALAGFGHKLCLDLSKRLGIECEGTGVSMIVHSQEVTAGQPKHLPQKPNETNAPDSFDVRSHNKISLVLRVNVPEEAELTIPVVAQQLLVGAFLAGGKVFPSATLPVIYQELHDLLPHISQGFVLLDRNDLLSSYASETGCDTLDALLDLIEMTPVAFSADGTPMAWERAASGWIVPLSVGFQAINKATVRARTRLSDGSPHVFAEAVYSVGEYRSLTSLKISNQTELLDQSFWSHRHNPETGTYFVSAH